MQRIPSQSGKPRGQGLFLLSLILLLNLPVHSQTILQLYSGLSHHFPAEIDLSLENQYYHLSGIHPLSHSLELPLYYGFSLGQWLRIPNHPILLQLEFLHDKFFIPGEQTVRVTGSPGENSLTRGNIPFSHFFERFSMTHGYNFLLLKIGLPLPWLSFSHLSALISLGGGFTVPHVESQREGQKQEQYELHGPAAGADLQFSWQVSRHWAFLLATKLTFARIEQARVTGGNLSGNFWSGHLQVGIQFTT